MFGKKKLYEEVERLLHYYYGNEVIWLDKCKNSEYKSFDEFEQIEVEYKGLDIKGHVALTVNYEFSILGIEMYESDGSVMYSKNYSIERFGDFLPESRWQDEN